MNEKKKEEKKHEMQKVATSRPVSAMERFDILPETSFFRDMDQIFAEYLPRRWWHWLGTEWPTRASRHLMPFEGKSPNVDVLDREADFLIRAELPGVDKDGINISIADNIVTLEAKVDREEEEEKGNYYRREISRGTFERSIVLPATVKEDQGRATFQNGVLELVIPKAEIKKRTKITVE